jgi:sulfatase modifying factor 1
MPVFGQYETVREVYHSAVTSLWTARAANSSAEPAFVIKLLTPPEGLWRSEEVGPAITAFLDRARLQQKVAGQGNSHWLPVHDLGEAEGGAYYVADLLPQTLQRPIAGQYRFSDETLFPIVSGIVAGLDEIFRVAKRYHGNLKVHNVLLAGQIGGKDLKVVLTDPAAEAKDPANDFFFLGQLIYEAVLRKPFKPLTGWPVGESEEWLAMGRKGERWRGLCNKLLCPDASERPADLPEMHRELRTLRLRLQSKASRVTVLVGALAVAIAAYGAFRYAEYKSDWPVLVSQYSDWFGRLHDHLVAHPEWVKVNAPPPALARELDEARNMELDPRKMSQGSLSTIRQTPRAAATVTRIGKSLAEWSLPYELARQKEHWAREGQTHLAEYLETLPRQVKPGPGVDVAAGIEKTLRTAMALAALDEQRRDLGQMAFRVEGVEGNVLVDRLVGRFSDRVKQVLAADPPIGDVGDIEKRAEELGAMRQRLAGFDGAIAARVAALAQRQRGLASAGWEKLAASVGDAINSITPDADLGGQARKLAELDAALGRADARWKMLVKQSEPMRKVRRDALLAGYLSVLEAVPQSADLTSLESRISSLDDIAEWSRVAEFLLGHVGDVDWDYFEATSKLPAPSQPPTSQEVGRWLAEVQKPMYAVLPADPRDVWKADLKPIREELAKLPAEAESMAGLEQRFAAAEREMAIVRALKWERGHVEEIRAGMGRLDDSIPKLLADVRAAIVVANASPVPGLRQMLEADKGRKKMENAKALLAAVAGLSPKERDTPAARELLADVKAYYQPREKNITLDVKVVRIEPGKFMMGSPPTEPGRPMGKDDDEAQFQCTLTKPFYIGAYEVTRDQFAAFAKESGYQTDAERLDASNPGKRHPTWTQPGFEQGGDHPVVCISWNDAVAFCKWLGGKEGRPCRLPSEYEWEYACRAGTRTAYVWGDDLKQGEGWLNGKDQTFSKAGGKPAAFAWADGFANTSPVGKFKPNLWGLYDMEGNAWEWTGSWYAGYPDGAATDPTPPRDLNGFRVIRGGAYGSEATQCRSGYRSGGKEDYSNEGTGFRIVLEPEY